MTDEKKTDNSDEIAELKSQLKQLNASVKKYETDLAHLQKENGDLKEEKTNLLKQGADKGGEKEKQDYKEHLEAEYSKKYGDKITGLEKSISERDAKIKYHEVVSVAMKKAGEYGILPKAFPFVQKEIEAQFDLFDGKIYAKGEDGKPKRSSDNPNNFVDLDHYFGNFVKEHDYMVGSKTTAGTRDESHKTQGSTS